MNGDSETVSHLDISKVAEGRISFKPGLWLTSGSSQRAFQSLRLVRSVFRQKLACVITQTETELTVELAAGPIDERLQVCSSVERKLEKIRLEPLPAKAVEEILAISSAERRRWSKDGRLPHVGNSLFRQGKKQVSLFVYSPLVVQELVRNPLTITQWRTAEKADSSSDVASA